MNYPIVKIYSARVLLTNGLDMVTLKTGLPCPFIPAGLPSQPLLDLQFGATYDTGVQYVRNTFGIEPEVMSIRD